MESSKSSNFISKIYKYLFLDYVMEYAHLRDFFKMLRISKKYYKFLINNSRVNEFQHYLSELRKSNLIVNRTIQRLNLEHNIMTSKPYNMKHLAEALKVNTTVREISLSSNEIGSNPDHMKYLAETLKVNTSIERLCLYNNQIGLNPDNMKYLVEALEVNTTIQISYD
jgi:hypothetical protein